MKRNEVIKIFFFIIGILSTAIAIIGIFLPLIPTTPLLLLAAYCFTRSSQKFYSWLITNRLCGVYIRNYREKKGIELKHKVLTMILLWLTISVSLFFVTNVLLKSLLIFIAIGVSIHLIKLKTLKTSKTHKHLNKEIIKPDKLLFKK